MKIIYWYVPETGMIVTSNTPLPDDMADRNCEGLNRAFLTLYHWTIRYIPVNEEQCESFSSNESRCTRSKGHNGYHHDYDKTNFGVFEIWG